MKQKRVKLLTIFILTFILFLSFFHTKVYADSCPSESGTIEVDTTWTKDNLVNGKYDCSDTDIVIKDVKLTLEAENENPSEVIMDVKSLEVKGDGDIKVRVDKSYNIKRTITETITKLKEPINIAKVTATVGISSQLISLTSFIFLQETKLASIVGLLIQMLLKRKPKENFWGIIYDTEAVKPVPFAIVRLYDTNTKKIVTTTVTDLDGRYGFPVSPGNYRIEVEHDEYNFPSESLDAKILQQKGVGYKGEKFSITQTSLIDFNIPIDPRVQKFTFNLKFISYIYHKLKYWFLRANMVFIVAMFTINLIVTIIDFNVLFLVFTITYFAIILIKSAKEVQRPRAWGVVFNSKSGKPVSSAFVKLFEIESKEIVDTKITDKNGRFTFYVPEKDYLLLVAATGYQFPSSLVEQKEADFYNSLQKIHASKGVVNIQVPIDPVSSLSYDSPFSSKANTNVGNKLTQTNLATNKT